MELEEVLKKEGFAKYIPAANTDKIVEVLQRTYFSEGEWKIEFYTKKRE